MMSEPHTPETVTTDVAIDMVMPAAATQLPVVLPGSPLPSPRPRWLLWLLMAGVLGGGVAAYWRLHRDNALPAGIAAGNGRLEADEIDIDTKYAGRIANLSADEGDAVKAGQVVAVMDTRDLQASLAKAQALVRQAAQSLDEARSNLEQQKTQVLLARQELERAQALVPKGFETREVLDQRIQAMRGALAAQSAAESRVGQAQHALDAAGQDVVLYTGQIADNQLVAPRDGRIEYRVANIGEVLPVGGKVFTMLDSAYVYMDVYLPTSQAGLAEVGAPARIVLDADPQHPIPSSVAMIAEQAQFTPKTVETRDERDTLMFRVRVRIEPEQLRMMADKVRSGLPGMAYVRLDPATPWPAAIGGDAAR